MDIWTIGISCAVLGFFSAKLLYVLCARKRIRVLEEGLKLLNKRLDRIDLSVVDEIVTAEDGHRKKGGSAWLDIFQPEEKVCGPFKKRSYEP